MLKIFDVKTMAGLHRDEAHPNGIVNPAAMGELCGISNGAVYSKVFRGVLSQIGDVTIKRVCDGFKCSPSDWIYTDPDLMSAEGRELRRVREALGLSPEDFAFVFSQRVRFNFDSESVNAWEDGRAKVRDGIWQAIAIALLDVGALQHMQVSSGQR
jgi:hypothetical protein